jgi:indolepyruvate ferredoxin oxidoreductase alpha subunit
LETKLITGNEAIVLGALHAGVKLAAGYPGTPSSGALGSLLQMDLDEGRHVEWSTNEKVALEIAAGVAWAGQRALCTMKMSGVNVCYDSLISIAYSGFRGSLVVYVADDPGMSAGMCEQDSRGFAIMSDMPMLEPASVAEAYELIQVAFDLSEQTGTPVFVRLVTGLSNSYAPVIVQEPVPPRDQEVILERDINKYTKAGAAIGTAQHLDLIARLARAGEIIDEMGLNRLDLAEKAGGLGIISAGVVSAYLDEGLKIAADHGLDRNAVSILRVAATNPFPYKGVRELLGHCDTILVLEELEPDLERNVYVEAFQLGFRGRIVGKLDGRHGQAALSRLGEYTVEQVVQGIGEATGLPVPEGLFRGKADADPLAAERPIACCPGCPHVGTYMAINKALRKLRLKKGDVMVTGDIGCTILGMNPPFHTIWNEISMGASVSLAQGYVRAGTKTPVIATIGDSTFFHGGIPGLVNAVQYQVDMTLIIMDNGWTAMTGMQVNPGTAQAFQFSGNQPVDIAKLVEGLGVKHFFVVDPFKLDEYVTTLTRALTLPGVKVILSRQECAIQAQRRGLKAGRAHVIPEECTLCKLCIIETGCPAIELGEDTITIDASLCYGCGLCAQVCNFEAIQIDREVA